MSLLEPVSRWQPGGDEPRREVVNPANGEVLGIVGLASVADVGRAAELAERARGPWAQVAAGYRAAVLRRAAAVFEACEDEIVWWLVREGGAVPGKAEAEVRAAAQTCHEAASLAGAPYGEVIRSGIPRLSLTRRVPAGIVGVITPFNMPLALAIRAVAPALVLGNAVILKPDPRTAVSGGVVLARVFEEAGLARGLLHVLPGDAEVGEAVVTEPRVRIVSFTGSAVAGRRVGELGGRLLKRVMLELGGNGALVVLDDVDLDRAVRAGAYASFFHQGQVCMAAGRHLVHENVYDEYVERLGEFAEGLTVGDPSRETVALGPLIDAAQRDRVHQLVSASVAAGAKLVAGGRFDGLYYRPTVLAEPEEPTPAYREEVFGPVAPVRPFATLGEAAELVADSESGLVVSILTADLGRGMALADRVPGGMIHVNDPTIDHEPNAPFGGMGSSGNGWRAGGAKSDLDAYTETQWLTLRTALPKAAL
ncbi:MAG TPA: benzaldehyde dehydrogenase [Micromonosporaceae bacterium]|nr:benzaldehyde dehydrogenase [Micromonosporaceae bacterium]